MDYIMWFHSSHDIQRTFVCVCVDLTVTLGCQVFPSGQMGLEPLDILVSRVN